MRYGTKWLLIWQKVGQWLGSGCQSLNAYAYPLPIIKLCTSCWTNIHIYYSIISWSHVGCLHLRLQ